MQDNPFAAALTNTFRDSNDVGDQIWALSSEYWSFQNSHSTSRPAQVLTSNLNYEQMECSPAEHLPISDSNELDGVLLQYANPLHESQVNNRVRLTFSTRFSFSKQGQVFSFRSNVRCRQNVDVFLRQPAMKEKGRERQ